MNTYLKTICIYLRRQIIRLAQILLTPTDCPLCSCRYSDGWSLRHGLCGVCDDFFKSLTSVKTTLTGDDPSLPELICFSAGFYDGLLRESVHQIKYLKNQRLLRFLGGAMQPPTLALLDEIDKEKKSARPRQISLIPVPLHRDKLRERSFNQAAAFAEHAQKSRSNMRLSLKGLCRVRATMPQFGLSQSDRRTNLAKAFIGDKRRIKGKAVIIVDDILTSGATLYECALAATAAGAIVLGAVTFGRARWQAKDRDQAHIFVPPAPDLTSHTTDQFFLETSERPGMDAHPPSATRHPGYTAQL